MQQASLITEREARDVSLAGAVVVEKEGEGEGRGEKSWLSRATMNARLFTHFITGTVQTNITVQ